MQDYIDQHNDEICLSLRLKWCSQAAKAIRLIHRKGVIHSDLRPEDFLLHAHQVDSPSLQLCDFGGSVCDAIDGGHLSDSGFSNPQKPWESTEATDIFSLGSVFYTIMTGHWPYRSPGRFDSVEHNWPTLTWLMSSSPPGNTPPGRTFDWGRYHRRMLEGAIYMCGNNHP